MAAVSPPLDMLLQLSVCSCGRMSLGLGECQWRAHPSVTVSGRLVMNGPGMRGEDGGERCEASACWVCSVACACLCAFNRRTNDEWSRNGDWGCVVNRCIGG